MSNTRQILAGLLIGLIAILVVAGGLSLSFAEGGISLAKLAPTPTATLSPSPISTRLAGAPTFTPSSIPSHTATSTLPPPPTNCVPPENWVPIEIKDGNSLEAIAEITGFSADQIAKANCLLVPILIPGSVLYVPFVTPTPTPSPEPECAPPVGWVLYTVQKGDNLFRLSIAFGVSVRDLQEANCLGNSTFIKTGWQIYVPDVPTRTPIPSSTLTPLPPTPSQTATTTPTPTTVPSSTPTSIPPSSTPTATSFPTPTASFTPTPLPTGTETPTATSTDSPTPPATASPTATMTPTETVTPVPPSPTPTPTPTDSLLPAASGGSW